ncbi:hypothetical protein FA95DRAFT_1463700, partial [Auriscalpium vulgare]
VTLTQRELLLLAPEVRAQIRHSVTPRRIPTAPVKAPQEPVAVMQTKLQAGRDEFAEAFGELCGFDDGDKPLIVAKELLALRAVLPLVDNQAHIEVILDPGSQVISMSEDTCHFLGLAYDPTITLDMLSANGSVDKLLGLARNVALKLGEITLYVQIHVIRSPTYDILLGRPFDVLTGSVVRNFPDERQTIMITNPNTQEMAIVPT